MNDVWITWVMGGILLAGFLFLAYGLGKYLKDRKAK